VLVTCRPHPHHMVPGGRSATPFPPPVTSHKFRCHSSDPTITTPPTPSPVLSTRHTTRLSTPAHRSLQGVTSSWHCSRRAPAFAQCPSTVAYLAASLSITYPTLPSPPSAPSSGRPFHQLVALCATPSQQCMNVAVPSRACSTTSCQVCGAGGRASAHHCGTTAPPARPWRTG